MFKRQQMQPVVGLIFLASIMLAFQNCGKSFQSPELGIDAFQSVIRQANITLLESPQGAINDTNPTIRWTVDNPDVVVHCQLPDKEVREFETACTSPLTLSDLEEGSQQLTLTAINDLGEELAYQNIFWTQDTTRPTVVVSNPPAPSGNQTVFSIDLLANGTGSSIESLYCALDPLNPTDPILSPCESPYEFTVADGAHTLVFQSRDLAGNLSLLNTVNFTVDNQASTVTITDTPGEIVGGVADISVSFSDPDPTATYTCSVDGAIDDNCSSPYTIPTPEDKLYVFTVISTDDAGNISDPAVYSFTRDGVLPTITLNNPPDAITSVNTFNFSFSAVDNVTLATLECRFGTVADPGTFADCIGGSFEPMDGMAIADGDWQFQIEATDTAGNVGSLTESFTIDQAAPTLSFDSTPMNPSMAIDVPFEFSADEAIETYSCVVTQAAAIIYENLDCSSPNTPTGIVSGDYTFTLTGTDLAGNPTTITFDWTVTP